jgi:hypothetical protein
MVVMKLTTYEHWLGKENINITSDVKKVLLEGNSIHAYYVPFVTPDGEIVKVHYSIRKMKAQKMQQMKNPSFSSPSIESEGQEYESSLVLEDRDPQGVLMIFELVDHHRHLIQGACR